MSGGSWIDINATGTAGREEVVSEKRRRLMESLVATGGEDDGVMDGVTDGDGELIVEIDPEAMMERMSDGGEAFFGDG